MGDRIYKIDIRPYDQVLALTQHMINLGIDNLYTRLETGEIVDNAKKPQLASFYADEHNFVKGVEFGPPTVTIKADYANVKSVIYNIKMKSGKLQLRRFLGYDEETNMPLAELMTLEMDDWIVSVPLDVSFNELDLESPRGKAVRERSAAKGNPDHSIYELLMDLKSMQLGNAVWQWGTWTENDYIVGSNDTKTRPPGWKLDGKRNFVDLPKEFQVSMEFYLAKISPNLMKSNLNSMGFAVMAKDANKRATFEVNDTRYMTYPWTNPDTQKPVPSGLDGDSRLNYLLYLETVGTHKPPLALAAESILSTRMGNWTEGRNPQSDPAGKFGTFMLSAANFMEEFVIPKFSAINRIMSIDIYDVTAWCKSYVVYYYYRIGASFAIGHGNPSDDKTTFKLNKESLQLYDDWHDGAKNFLRPLTESPGSGAIVWTYKDIEWSSTAKHAYSHDSPVEVWMHGDTITFTRLYIIPNTNQIVYEGRTWSKFEYKIDPSIIDPNKYGKTICQCQWKITLTMQEVTDGGMKIDVDYERPSTSFPEHYGDGLDYIKDNVQNMYESAYANFEYFINSLRNLLQGQEKFTLPASGVFYFKNPVFNTKGDLVCDLEYNGNPKLGGNINKDAKGERDNVGRGTFNDMPAAAEFKMALTK